MKEGKNKKSKFNILPKSTGLSIAILIMGFAEAVFLMLVIALDVLPFKLLAVIIVILLLFDLFILLLMNTKTKRGTRRIAGLVVIVLVLNVLLVGDYYVYSTYDTLQKISKHRSTWEYYEVIALNNGSYETVEDIAGQTVAITDTDSKQLTEASERLITKEAIELKKVRGLIALGRELVDNPAAEEVSETEINKAKEAAAEIDEKTKREVLSGEKSQSNGNVTGETATDLETTNGEGSEKTDTQENLKSKLHDRLILVSRTEKKLINANITGFNANTKAIYTMKVMRRADDNSKAVDVTKDSFNVLISGMDQWGKIELGGLSDVNMVMTVNPETREILLTSIPRDSYITFHSYGMKDKLTHTGIYGEKETKATIEDFLEIDINYTIKVNFSMLCDIVDAIGGIRIYNDTDFMSHPKGWHYKKGWHNMNGKCALWFARERKSFLEGDMKRNENQQKVLTAIIKKVTSSKVILTRYTSILNAVEDEMQTDMTDKDLKKLAKMQLKDMHKWNITRVNIKGATGGAPCFSMGGQNLSCVFPDEQTVEDSKKAIHDLMYPVDNTVQNSSGNDTDKNNNDEDVNNSSKTN